MFGLRGGLWRLTAMAVLLVVSLISPLLKPVFAQQGCQTFPDTGKTVCGIFLKYWNEHGGLAQQGFPISAEASEVSDTDGKTYTVQYFERAVFEYHPEFAAPNNVLLSLLGNFRYKQKYPDGAPNQSPNASTGSVLFEQTGKRLGGKFLEYWKSHGALAQQGYPISDEFTEVSDLDGKTYTVQYFERAVFEYHPEFAPPNDVLLSQLGTFRYREKYGSTPPPPALVPVPPAPAPVSGPYAATAWVSDPTPPQKGSERVMGKLLRGGQPVQGAVMNTTWHYKSKDTPCSGAKTDANGEAGCTNDIGNATIGFAVNIDVSFVVNGQVVATAKTSFTPRQ